MRQYFLSIPRDLEEAARIDGAGFFTTFWRVMLPLAGAGPRGRRDPPVPGRLERLLLAAVFLRDQDHYTLPLALELLPARPAGSSTNWPPLMAVVVIATIPILVLYIFFQRYFVEGIAATGVKG